ncbi:MAG TPA: YciI family protein [Acidimicrobiales bacterium]|nr:YciI family protein [Acidimicrobiales bacterium]
MTDESVIPTAFDTFTFVILRMAPNPPVQSDDEAMAQQLAHLGFLKSLQEQGKLLAAGPLLGQADESVRGIAFFSVPPDEVRALFEKDPHVVGGTMVVDVMEWMTPAGGVTFTPAWD